MIHEPAVALTDYAIAIECGVLAAFVVRKGRGAAASWFAQFFGAIGVSAALGGSVHGFVTDETTAAYAILWHATLVSIGAVSLAAAMAAGNCWNGTVQKVTREICFAGFILYCIVVLFVRQDFRTAIIAYLPATLFLLVSFGRAYALSRDRRVLVGALGMALTLVAAGVQQSSFAVGVLDHNSIYHVIQAFALAAVYVGAVGVVRLKDMRGL